MLAGGAPGQGQGWGCGWQVTMGAMDILEELSQDSAAEVIFS